MNPEYILERHAHGWLVCSPPGQSGVPASFMKECLPLFNKRSQLESGIAHHYQQSGRNGVVTCISTNSEGAKWKKECNDRVKDCDPEERWWRGTDVGLSSAAMFAALCSAKWFYAADNMGNGHTPSDSDDFGRCLRLIQAIPEWRLRIYEVAAKYPTTKWPAITARWSELEAATPEKQSEILRSL